MNLRLMLSIALLVLIIVSLITYGYVVYTVKSNAGASPLVTSKPMLFYSPLIIQILQFITSGLLVYKA